MIFATATILLILEPDGRNRSYYTEACDKHVRQLERVIPEADILCVPPGYTMRPRARPADLKE